MTDFQPGKIETKWQKMWIKSRLYSPDLDVSKNPFYNLMMFPYPSAEGLHVGNMYAFTGSDIYGRFKRMQGYSVFEPIGLDGFGIHSENYAIKVNRNPKDQAKISQKNFYRQLKATGNSYDWGRTLETYVPNYYKWTQWIYIQLFKAGLAYRAKSPVNFCPSCKTVLADEQVIDNKCERCHTVVEKKELEQWFFRITDYADRLLDGLSQIDWSERVKVAQKNWIGKKEGITIRYQVLGYRVQIECWTSRPDTNFGATFVVLAPEHPRVLELTSKENKKGVAEYIKVTRSKTNGERIREGREKSGVFTGRYVVNNLTGEKMPVWVSDFVLMDFGTGAVVGVPGHDRRDFEFASKFKLPIKRVVVGKDGDKSEIKRIEQVCEEEGKMVNSEFLNGLDIHKATRKIMDYLEKKDWGKRKMSYHLRDWLISRQRYWGSPIPIIYCRKCWEVKSQSAKVKSMEGKDFIVIVGKEYAVIPVPEKDLPVELPDVKDWRPAGTSESPLASVESFVKTKCPNCKGKAKRETDVSDTFLDSSWYFLRYLSTEDLKRAWSAERAKKWLPVDMYIGGAEHSVLHLMYARFLTMVFKDLGLVNFEEPFTKFRAHGLLISRGAKMSKSRGNIVNPDDYIEKYGSDTLRCYLMFCGRFQQGGDFKDEGIEGISRFLKRVWNLVTGQLGSWDIGKSSNNQKTQQSNNLQIMHKTIKQVTEDIESLDYNTAISALMIWLNFFEKKVTVSSENLDHSSSESKNKRLQTTNYELITREEVKNFLLLLAPFAPHMTEELYQRFRAGRTKEDEERRKKFESIHFENWPEYNEKLAKAKRIVLVIQVNGKVRDRIEASRGLTEKEAEKLALDSERIKKYASGKDYKIIYVTDKLINFVLN